MLQGDCKFTTERDEMTNTPTPRTDRETYTIKTGDIGFQAISPSLGKILERENAELRQQLAALKQKRREDVRKCEADVIAFLETEYPMTRKPLQAAMRKVFRAAFPDDFKEKDNEG